MVVCRLDFRHVMNKYKQTKLLVVCYILPGSRLRQPGRLTKRVFWKKKRQYHRIHELLLNLTIFSTE